MAIFNNIINHLSVIELPLKGRSYTWSNMQSSPLLEQLDWFFTSFAWTPKFPNTMVLPLARITSDHVPCKVAIGTSIPRSNIFCFENYWAQLPSLWMWCRMPGKPSRELVTVLMSLQPSSSSWEGLWNIGLKTCPIWPSSYQIAILLLDF